MTFDEWLEQNEHLFHGYSCYTEYSGQIYSMLEETWQAAQKEALIKLAQNIKYTLKDL